MHTTFLKKIKNQLINRSPQKKDIHRQDKNLTRDHIDLKLWGLALSVTRETNLDIPSELSVILPRVEYRRSCTPGDPPVCDTEIIYNSLTVVIAPRHPLAGPPPADAAPGNKRSTLV